MPSTDTHKIINEHISEKIISAIKVLNSNLEQYLLHQKLI